MLRLSWGFEAVDVAVSRRASWLVAVKACHRYCDTVTWRYLSQGTCYVTRAKESSTFSSHSTVPCPNSQRIDLDVYDIDIMTRKPYEGQHLKGLTDGTRSLYHSHSIECHQIKISSIPSSGGWASFPPRGLLRDVTSKLSPIYSEIRHSFCSQSILRNGPWLPCHGFPCGESSKGELSFRWFTAYCKQVFEACRIDQSYFHWRERMQRLQLK